MLVLHHNRYNLHIFLQVNLIHRLALLLKHALQMPNLRELSVEQNLSPSNQRRLVLGKGTPRHDRLVAITLLPTPLQGLINQRPIDIPVHLIPKHVLLQTVDIQSCRPLVAFRQDPNRLDVRYQDGIAKGAHSIGDIRVLLFVLRTLRLGIDGVVLELAHETRDVESAVVGWRDGDCDDLDDVLDAGVYDGLLNYVERCGGLACCAWRMGTELFVAAVHGGGVFGYCLSDVEKWRGGGFGRGGCVCIRRLRSNRLWFVWRWVFIVARTEVARLW